MNHLIQCVDCGEWYLEGHDPHEFFKTQLNSEGYGWNLVPVSCVSPEWDTVLTSKGLSCVPKNPRAKPHQPRKQMSDSAFRRLINSIWETNP